MGVVGVDLVDPKRQCGLRMTDLDADDRQLPCLEFVEQPSRKPAGRHTDPHRPGRMLGKRRAKAFGGPAAPVSPHPGPPHRRRHISTYARSETSRPTYCRCLMAVLRFVTGSIVMLESACFRDYRTEKRCSIEPRKLTPTKSPQPPGPAPATRPGDQGAGKNTVLQGSRAMRLDAGFVIGPQRPSE
jgi:hypothetical protein